MIFCNLCDVLGFWSTKKILYPEKCILYPEKSFCIPKKVFCIPKKFLVSQKKIFVSQNKHHLRGTLYPQKAFCTPKKVAPSGAWYHFFAWWAGSWPSYRFYHSGTLWSWPGFSVKSGRHSHSVSFSGFTSRECEHLRLGGNFHDLGSARSSGVAGGWARRTRHLVVKVWSGWWLGKTWAWPCRLGTWFSLCLGLTWVAVAVLTWCGGLRAKRGVGSGWSRRGAVVGWS